MEKHNMHFVKYTFMMMLIISTVNRGNCQNTMPDVLITGTLREQLDYLNDKTRIYEDYRAIREDMFQKIRSNTIDSIKVEKNKVIFLKNINLSKNKSIDSLNTTLESTRLDLEKVTKTKNSIKILGIEINKSGYNAVMWTLIIFLAGALVFGFLAFTRNQAVTSRTKKEYEDLRKEFEAYRKAAREAREKMSMAHFNEVRKLRGA
jgi:hypothetical protein